MRVGNGAGMGLGGKLLSRLFQRMFRFSTQAADTDKRYDRHGWTLLGRISIPLISG
jgi:hypothetical protein